MIVKLQSSRRFVWSSSGHGWNARLIVILGGEKYSKCNFVPVSQLRDCSRLLTGWYWCVSAAICSPPRYPGNGRLHARSGALSKQQVASAATTIQPYLGCIKCDPGHRTLFGKINSLYHDCCHCFVLAQFVPHPASLSNASLTWLWPPLWIMDTSTHLNTRRGFYLDTANRTIRASVLRVLSRSISMYVNIK